MDISVLGSFLDLHFRAFNFTIPNIIPEGVIVKFDIEPEHRSSEFKLQMR
jgi:hypothetical protein